MTATKAEVVSRKTEMLTREKNPRVFWVLTFSLESMSSSSPLSLSLILCFTRTASFLTSIIVPVLMKKRISDKERGLDDEIDSSVKVKTRKTLGLYSLVNISVFLLTTSAFVAVIYLTASFKTNLNNIVSIEQMMEIFLFVFLPSCGVAVISSVLLCLIPAAKMKGKLSKVKMTIDISVVIVAILIPVLSGIFLVNPMPRSVFVLLKVRNLTVLPLILIR